MTYAPTRTARPDRVVAPPPARPRPAGPASGGRRRRTPLLLLAPALLVLLAALGYPLFRQAVMSFQEYGLAQQFGQPPEWVGFDNYQALLTDPYLWTVVARSVVFCLAVAAATMVVGVALAVLMTLSPRAPRLVLQIGLLVAWAMPHLASLTVWQWLFDSQYGVVNWVLTTLGWDGFAGHSWLIDQLSFFVVAGVVVIWMSVPFVAFAVYAGLTQVPDDLHEAAAIGTYIYRLGIGEGQFGLAAAASWFILLLTVALSLYYVRILLREEGL